MSHFTTIWQWNVIGTESDPIIWIILTYIVYYLVKTSQPTTNWSFSWQLWAFPHWCHALLVNLNQFERTHRCTPKYISHANSRLALQTLPLEIIPQGAQRTEWLRAGEKMRKMGENRMGGGIKESAEKVIEYQGSCIDLLWCRCN